MKWNDYYWYFIAAALIALMAFLERQVRPLYILAAVMFVVGLVAWISKDIGDAAERRGRRRAGR